MKRYIAVWLVLCFLIPWGADAQFGREKSALNNMERGKWDRAKTQLQKSISKDSLNAYARFVFACYYFSEGNPEFHIDSAYNYVMMALADYQVTDARDKEKMLRLPLDSSVLVGKREQIDSAAFDRATRTNTERAYIDFLEDFPFASQRERAIELRNEVAFIDALKVNTYQSFLDFLEKYPDSNRAKEARDKYEKLLYEAMTKDKKLASYEKFLSAYPGTPYRREVEQQIFEISTVSGHAKVFQKFLNEYPRSHLARRARSLLYYLLKESGQPIPRGLINDSIKNVMSLERLVLIPYLNDDKFGFFSDTGQEILKPFTSEISQQYLCGNVTDDVLIVKNKIVARNGKVLYGNEFDEADDLGYGFIAVAKKNCVKIIHKSGESIFTGCFEDAKLLDGNYLALKKDGSWGLYTLTGRLLASDKWREIDKEDDVIIFKNEQNYSITLANHVANTADRHELKILFECNDYRVWPGGLIWLRKGNQQALVTTQLTERIPFGNHEISFEYFGLITRSRQGYKLHYGPSESTDIFDRVKVSKPWVAARRGASWSLFDPEIKLKVSHQFDSVDFRGPFALGFNSDTIRVCFNPVNYVVASLSTRLQFIPGKDSVFFLLLTEGDMKSLYDMHGQKLFTVNYDKIEYYGADLFQIYKREKRGLMSSNARVLLPPEFDALGRLQDGLVPVLKDKKFGLINLAAKVEIKPMYEKNVLRYNQDLLIACKDGYCGLISWNNRPVTKFEFEEIRFWNDRVALVKKNFQWFFYDIDKNSVVMEKIRDFKWVRDSEEEKIVIIHHDNNFGVVSNQRGEIIPATFSDIVNVGSELQPVYFTEKHVEEASIFVVIYYDENGKLLKRQVFELDDYERIYCTGK